MRERSVEQGETVSALCMSWVLSKAALSALLPACRRCRFSPRADFVVLGSFQRVLFLMSQWLFSCQPS